jgi:hypothetical protein
MSNNLKNIKTTLALLVLFLVYETSLTVRYLLLSLLQALVNKRDKLKICLDVVKLVSTLF